MSRCKRVATAALLLLASACGGSAASSVEVDRDQTDIVFGFATPAPRKAAVTGPVPTPLPDEDVVFTPKPFPTIFDTEPEVACPTAEPNAPIEGSTGTAIKGRPKPGTYPWSSSGHVVVNDTKIPINGRSDHYVRSVESFEDQTFGGGSGDTFTYQAIARQQSTSGSGFWLFSYQVKTDGTNADPEAGLVLKRIDLLRPDGTLQSTYFDAFAGGVLLVPFPIRAGEQWSGTSVDFARGKTFSISGQVLRREAVDVCGKLVQGWNVRTEITESGATAMVDSVIAPDHAGTVISTTIDGTYLGALFENANFHTDSLTPEPLPEELEP